MAYFFDYDEGRMRPENQEPDVSQLPSGKKELETFKARLHEEILRSQRRKYGLALMRIAIDTPSHEKERAIPMGFADILKSKIREYDVLCTLRDDEYVIAFPETEEQFAEEIAGRIRQSVEQKLWTQAVDEAYQANIGIACFPHDGTNAEDLLSSAEHDLRITRRLKR